MPSVHPAPFTSMALGLVVLFTGYYFLAKSRGQDECEPKPESRNRNYNGGVAGTVIGAIFIVVGLGLIAFNVFPQSK